jgi:hypothetical protein
VLESIVFVCWNELKNGKKDEIDKVMQKESEIVCCRLTRIERMEYSAESRFLNADS